MPPAMGCFSRPVWLADSTERLTWIPVLKEG
jgi:hypothetical protein